MTRFELAVTAAHAAGKSILSVSPTEHVEAKEGNLNFVTLGDKKSEEILLGHIHREYPDDAVLSEETESDLTNEQILTAPHLWILDPIDGTSNFRYERKYSCVSVGYAEHGILQFGVAFDPFRDELFTGERDKGAFHNCKKLRVGQTTNLSQATVIGSNSYNPDTYRRQLETIMKISPIPWLLIKGSAVLEMCEVAGGQADIYFSMSLRPWDNAAAMLIVTEAGGVIKNLKGERVSFLSPEAVVGNETLVDTFIRAVS